MMDEEVLRWFSRLGLAPSNGAPSSFRVINGILRPGSCFDIEDLHQLYGNNSPLYYGTVHL